MRRAVGGQVWDHIRISSRPRSPKQNSLNFMFCSQNSNKNQDTQESSRNIDNSINIINPSTEAIAPVSQCQQQLPQQDHYQQYGVYQPQQQNTQNSRVWYIPEKVVLGAYVAPGHDEGRYEADVDCMSELVSPAVTWELLKLVSHCREWPNTLLTLGYLKRALCVSILCQQIVRLHGWKSMCVCEQFDIRIHVAPCLQDGNTLSNGLLLVCSEYQLLRDLIYGRTTAHLTPDLFF